MLKHYFRASLALLATAGAAQSQTPASFGAVRNYSTGALSNPYGVAVADVNGDGWPDIVTANYNSNTAGVLLGTGTGNFGAVVFYSTGPSSNPNSIAVADVNGDGQPDLVTANNNSTAGVLLGTSTGTFGAVVSYPTGPGSYPTGVAVADVNGDGRPDIVTANVNSSTVGVLLSTGAGAFGAVVLYPTGPGSSPFSVAVADVNGDGRPDIVAASYGTDTAGVLLGTSTGTFGAVVSYPTGPGSYPTGVAVADVNGDGRLDIVTANASSSTVGVLLGTGAGAFGAVVLYPTGPGSSPSSVAVADVNGDGRPDIVAANASSSTVGVLLGTSTGTFGAVQAYSISPGSTPFSLAVADVNGDRRPDIVTANNGSSTASVLLNTGTYTPLAAAPAAPAAEAAALFPNPVRGGFALRLPAAWGAAPARAELLNSLGQVVAAHTFSGGATLPFATDGLAAGVYVLRVQAGSRTLVRRVVID